MILDVGSQSVERINAAINDAATLVWNGPLGAFEIAPFDQGTVAAARHAAERTRAGKLVSVAGGGDTVAALNHAGVADRLHLRLDGRRRVPGMARRQGSAGGRGVARLSAAEAKCPGQTGVWTSSPTRAQESTQRRTSWPASRFASFSITPPSTATACRPSTSTTWSRASRSWRRPNAVDAPVIIQASRGARQYANDIMLARMIDALVEIYPHIPVCMHLDHGNEPVHLPHRHPVRLHLGDDGRIAQGGRQDPGGLRLQRRRHPQGRRDGPSAAASRSRASSACSARSSTAKARRRTATAPRASSRTTSF